VGLFGCHILETQVVLMVMTDAALLHVCLLKIPGC
jgi:hypothetical protein